MADVGTCPECGVSFPVHQYGRRLPCPSCGELLDISPDHDTPARIPPCAWIKACQARMRWLKGLSVELEGYDCAEFIRQIEGEIEQLRRFVQIQ